MPPLRGWRSVTDVTGFSYDAFDRAKGLVASGEAAARTALPALLKWVGEEVPAAEAVESTAVIAASRRVPQPKPAAA
ncbi:MAG: hypothetical protein ACE14L_02685 [Terriglobales bacterium]